VCTPVPCPRGSGVIGENAISGCRCRDGYEITESFEVIPSPPYVKGACTAVECPPHSRSTSGYVFPKGCTCVDGYTGEINLGNPYDGECTPVPVSLTPFFPNLRTRRLTHVYM